MTPVLDRTDLEQFRTIVARRLGLQYEDGKLDYLAEVVRRRMEVVGSTRFESYLERLISSPKGSDEFRALAEQLTVNETFFFRNADNFRAFAEIVLPERIRANRQEKRLRILSAGCASGEEPYSLAVLVREALSDLGNWDVKVIGIDVNPAVLAKATQARYSAWSLRATSEDAKRRYFRADGQDFVLAPAIQKMVTFEERNLVDEDPLFWQSLACDVVFCRTFSCTSRPTKRVTLCAASAGRCSRADFSSWATRKHFGDSRRSSIFAIRTTRSTTGGAMPPRLWWQRKHG